MTEAEFREIERSWGSETSRKRARFVVRVDRLEVLGVIALTVFAIASDLGLSIAVIVSCLCVGWNEYCLTEWLRRSDSDRVRGRTISLFYLCWGIWKVILAAIVMVLVFGFTMSNLEQPAPKSNPPTPPPSYAMTAFLVITGGILVQGLLAILAVGSAIRYPLRIWVGPEPRWAYRARVWPPQAFQPRRVTENRARIIIISALISLLALGLAVLMVVSTFTVNWMISETLALSAMGVYLVLGVLLIRVLLDVLERRMIAPTPEACWADSVER